MKTHYICQNSMTGAIHTLVINPVLQRIISNGRTGLTPCGYYVNWREFLSDLNIKKKSKICIKCHKSLLKSHNKNLIAYISHLKLTGKGENPSDRIKI